ncbi:hypothetical protein [Azospirillum palustre]
MKRAPALRPPPSVTDHTPGGRPQGLTCLNSLNRPGDGCGTTAGRLRSLSRPAGPATVAAWPFPRWRTP